MTEIKLCVCPHCGKDILVDKETLQTGIKEAVKEAFEKYWAPYADAVKDAVNNEAIKKAQ